jgi:hypothetical protein
MGKGPSVSPIANRLDHFGSNLVDSEGSICRWIINYIRASSGRCLEIDGSTVEVHGEWIFDPADKAQAALTLKLVGPRRKRLLNLSDEQRQVLRDRLQSARLVASAK